MDLNYTKPDFELILFHLSDICVSSEPVPGGGMVFDEESQEYFYDYNGNGIFDEETDKWWWQVDLP